MLLTIYLVVLWIISFSLILSNQAVNKKELLFFTMLGIFLYSHVFTILMELGYLIPTKNKLQYFTYLLFRVILSPILLLFFVNLFYSFTSHYARACQFILFLSIFLFFEILNINDHLYSYHIWTSASSSLFHLCTFTLFLLLKYFNKKVEWFSE
jgi:hypothetical protein